MNAGAGWVGRRDVHGYCGASEESTIQRGRQYRRAGYRTLDPGPRAQIVLCAACRIVSSVKLSSVKRSPGCCEVSNKRARDHETFKAANQHKVRYSASTRLRSASLHTMHAHSHARSHALTYRHTRRETNTQEQIGEGGVSFFPLEAGPGERASERSVVGKRPRWMQRRGDSR